MAQTCNCMAWGVLGLGPVVVEAFEVTDDWNRDNADPPGSGWTEEAGTGYNIYSQQLRDSCNCGHTVLRCTTALANSYRQYVKEKFVARNNASPALRVRMTSTYANAHYIVMFNTTTVTWYKSDYNVIESASFVIDEGNWWGVEVEGTGTDTVMRVWEWTSDPGQRSAWGAPSITFTNNPSVEANSGMYVAIGGYDGAGTLYDDFAAGSSASAP